MDNKRKIVHGNNTISSNITFLDTERMALKVTLENTAFRSSGNTEIITREKGLKER